MAPRRLDPKSLPPDSTLAALFRARALSDRAPISFEHDGHSVHAFEGEPVSVSLLAHGIDAQARSVKFHRPRGPSCLRGACDGCLVRHDGVPNVMACRVRARDGARVESQNSFPSAQTDVLRVTDWFFPKQFDHHHLMVQFGPTLNRAMQLFARRMAGLGTLPDRDVPVERAEEVTCDVLIVGAGSAGLAAAATLAQAGISVLVLEEETEAGGTLRDTLELLGSAHGPAPSGAAFANALVHAARAAGARIRTETGVVATFDDVTLAVGGSHALRIRARTRLFANGAHEWIPTFEQNDLPGVYTARAAARALLHGVTVGEQVLIVGASQGARGLHRALTDAGIGVDWVTDGQLKGARGNSAVTGATVLRGGREERFRCDAICVAQSPTPAFELLGQAGAMIDPHEGLQGFVPRTDEDGRTERPDVFAVGEVALRGGPLGPVDLRAPLRAGGPVASGVHVAKAIATALGAQTAEVRR